MSTAADTQYDADFTRNNYRALLVLAQQHYRFHGYDALESETPALWWRHDVDMSMHAALALAKIEAELGIRATYFLLPGSAFYHILEPEILRIIHQTRDLGHAFGLHFDATKYPIDSTTDLEKFLHHERRLLETYCGLSLTAFSFHNPSEQTLSFRAQTYAGLTNTYADYFRNEVAYCSDSNGTWRHTPLQNVLEHTRPQRLQVLTHPEWWTEFPMSPRRRVYRAVEGRARKVLSDNNKLLQQFNRPNHDALEDLFTDWESLPGVNAMELQTLCLSGNETLAYLSLWRHAAQHSDIKTPAFVTPHALSNALLEGENVGPDTVIAELRLLTAALMQKAG